MDTTRGIYQKFVIGAPRENNSHFMSNGDKCSVMRTDGESAPGAKHDGCRYFVIHTNDTLLLEPHRTAILTYATDCRAEYPGLAHDLESEALSGSMEFFCLDLDHDPFAANAVKAFEVKAGHSISDWSVNCREGKE